jgi:hypothetical protein
VPLPTRSLPPLDTPEGRRPFFLHVLQDTGQSLEDRVSALDEFVILTQRDAYQAGWNDARRPQSEPAAPKA